MHEIKRLDNSYPRVWGINVGKITKEMRMKETILDDNDGTAATAAMTEQDDNATALTDLT